MLGIGKTYYKRWLATETGNCEMQEYTAVEARGYGVYFFRNQKGERCGCHESEVFQTREEATISLITILKLTEKQSRTAIDFLEKELQLVAKEPES